MMIQHEETGWDELDFRRRLPDPPPDAHVLI